MLYQKQYFYNIARKRNFLSTKIFIKPQVYLWWISLRIGIVNVFSVIYIAPHVQVIQSIYIGHNQDLTARLNESRETSIKEI